MEEWRGVKWSKVNCVAQMPEQPQFGRSDWDERQQGVKNFPFWAKVFARSGWGHAYDFCGKGWAEEEAVGSIWKFGA